MKSESSFLKLSRPFFIFLHFLKVQFRNLKLHWKIQILVLSIMLAGYALTAVFFHYFTSVYDLQLYADSATILSLSMQAMENEMSHVLAASSGLVTDSIIQESIRQMEAAPTEYEEYTARQSLMNRFYMSLNKKKYILSVTYVDPSLNTNTIGSDTSLFPDGDMQKLYDTAFSDNGRPVWVNVGSATPILILLCPIREVENLSLRPMGMLAVRINIPRLVQSVLDIRASAGEDFYIFTDEAVRTAGESKAGASSLPALYHYGSAEENLLPAALLPLPADMPYQIAGEGIDKRFIVNKTSAYTGWTYCYAIPYDNIYSRFRELKIQRSVIFIAVYLFLVIITIHFSKSLTKPLKLLARQMDRLSNVDFGNSVISFSDTSRKDEIGMLQDNFRLMIRKIQSLVKENYVRQLAIKDSEYRTLQAQINPHFMYNTLDSVYWMAVSAGQTSIASMTYSLGKLLRESIKYQDNFDKLTTLREELELLAHYITIQRIRFPDKLDFQTRIAQDAFECRVPKLILQPLAENSVNYGVESTARECRILLSAVLEEDYLILRMEDNGIGVEDGLLNKLESGERKPRGSGIGLKNIRSRLKILYGEDGLLDIRSAGAQGAIVTLRIPQ